MADIITENKKMLEKMRLAKEYLWSLIKDKPPPDKKPEVKQPKQTIINDLWRKNNNSSRQSNKNSIENSLKFFDIYKNLK